jgi:hypothetical protein
MQISINITHFDVNLLSFYRNTLKFHQPTPLFKKYKKYRELFLLDEITLVRHQFC